MCSETRARRALLRCSPGSLWPKSRSVHRNRAFNLPPAVTASRRLVGMSSQQQKLPDNAQACKLKELEYIASL